MNGCCSPLGPAPSPSPSSLVQLAQPLAGMLGPSFSGAPMLPNSGQLARIAAVVSGSPLAGLVGPSFSGFPVMPNQFGTLLPTNIGFQEANAAAIGPAATVTFTTAAVVPRRSGVYFVWGELNANSSGVSTQTGTLRLDVAGPDTVLDQGIAGTGGAGPFNLSFVAFVTVARNVSHTWSLRAVASAGTNTIPILDSKIMLLELP